MDQLSIEFLRKKLERQRAFLTDMEKSGRAKVLIERMKIAIKVTQRQIERAEAADYEESIKKIKRIGE